MKKNEWDTENVISMLSTRRESHLYAPLSSPILKVVGATAAFPVILRAQAQLETNPPMTLDRLVS